jgi:hypothetical protein
MREATPLRHSSIPWLLGALALGTLGAASGAQTRGAKPLARPEPAPTAVGASMAIKVEPKLEHAFESNGRYQWAELVHVPGVSFVKAHLVDVNLRAGDVLTLRSASGRVVEEIRGRGPKDQGSFWALSAFGEELLLELDFARPYAKAPFWIDQVILGDAAILSQAQSPESICAPENFDDVFCYQGDAGKWANVLASVGVMTVGGNPASALFCSGSNVSPQNYLLTNRHCITSDGDCDTSEFVFKYYRQGCNSGAATTPDWQSFRCDQVVASSPFVSCDQGLGDLDYSLCSVIGDPAATFGFATPDPVRLTDGEAIYIVQHPAGRPHEIAHGSGSDVDVSGTVLRYYDTLDTEGGSSGSPIYRESDDKLVGLHHCGGCETAGVGNRGMLMADIYPEISAFLCTPAVSLQSAPPSGFTQVRGDGDATLEPGETWRFTPKVRNVACSALALAASAEVRLNAGSLGQAQLLGNLASFGDVAAGGTANALAPITFRIPVTATCGATIAFDLVNLSATNGGPFPDALAFTSAELGEEPFTTLFSDGFNSPPGGWTTVNGGTGAGPAQTWTTANPGLRSLSLTAPYFIADSDELGSGFTMDEQLIGPVVSCAGFTSVQLQFKHDFHWYSGGLEEQCDVDVRSSATGGAWVNVAKFQDADTSGTVTLDISAQAANRSDVQVRFHYYNAVFEWWWAVDDVVLLGSNGFDCDVFTEWTFGGSTPIGPGGKAIK